MVSTRSNKRRSRSPVADGSEQRPVKSRVKAEDTADNLAESKEDAQNKEQTKKLRQPLEHVKLILLDIGRSCCRENTVSHVAGVISC